MINNVQMSPLLFPQLFLLLLIIQMFREAAKKVISRVRGLKAWPERIFFEARKKSEKNVANNLEGGGGGLGP